MDGRRPYCIDCGEDQISLLCKDKRKAFGVAKLCRRCSQARQRKRLGGTFSSVNSGWNKRNPERRNEALRRWRRKLREQATAWQRSITDAIIAWREAHNLTQREFGKLAGLSKAQVANREQLFVLWEPALVDKCRRAGAVVDEIDYSFLCAAYETKRRNRKTGTAE